MMNDENAQDILDRLNDHLGTGLSLDAIISLHRDINTFPMCIQSLIEAVWYMHQYKPECDE